jgi:hypothetical protein
MRIATVITVFWLIGWYIVYGQNIWNEVEDVQSQQRQNAKDLDAGNKDCNNYNKHKGDMAWYEQQVIGSKLSAKDSARLDQELCEWAREKVERISHEPPETTQIVQIIIDNALFVFWSVIGIWGFFS